MTEKGTVHERVRKADTWRDSLVHPALNNEWLGTNPGQG